MVKWKQVWKHLINNSKAFFMKFITGKTTFVVIKTVVDELEYTLPRDNVYEVLSAPFE